MSGIFKEKPLGFYIGLVSPVLSVIVAIIILLYGMSVNDFYAIPPVLLLIGAGCACVGLFCKIHFFYDFTWGVLYGSGGHLYQFATGQYLR